MKALIIDNEAPIRESLHQMLIAFCPEIKTIKEAGTIQMGLDAIHWYDPDIVFLDVELDEGTGFDLLTRLPAYNFQLIFITAHDKYAINAFKFSALDFLLKPIDPDELVKSVGRASKNVQHDPGKQLSLLLEQMQHRHEHPKKIVLRDLHKTYYVKIDEILYLEAEGIYTRFYLTGQQQILVSKNLKEYESMLESLGFVRTHHSFLVNPEKIKLFDKSEGGMLLLDEGNAIPVSQRKREVVLRMLEH